MKKAWTFQRKGIKGWWVGWYECGKRKSKAFPNKTLAEHFKQIKYTQLNSDVFTGTINIDWQQMVDEYERTKRVAGFQDTSIYEAQLTLKHFERIVGPLASGQIVQMAIDRFILQRQDEVKRFTVNKDINNLKAFIHWAAKSRYILPGLELKKLKTDSYLPTTLSAQQIDRLLNAAQQESDVWYVRILLALTTGLRGNDIECLRVSDINFETNTVHTRSKKTRKQMLERPLPADIVPLLVDYVNNLPPGQVKLLDDRGDNYPVRRKAWDRIRQRAKVPTARFKDLRATFSSELQKQGVSLAIARPFEHLALPGRFEVLQRRMEWELDHGRREYIQVLRLLERYSVQQLTSAVQETLRRRVHTKDGVTQFLTGCLPWRQTTFTLNRSEHLRLVQISKSDVRVYGDLLGQGGVA